MKLRSRMKASQNFADSVPNESMFTYPEILSDMADPTEMAEFAQNRMNDLNRQSQVKPKSLLSVSSYPVDTISTTSSVRSSNTMSSSSSSSLVSGGGNSSSQ